MTARLDSYQVLALLDAGWTDLADDIISDIEGRWGISGLTPKDRLADTGTLKFSLLNNDGKYSAGEATALAGWEKGIAIQLVLVYDGDNYFRFSGTVEGIDLKSGITGYTTAEVTVVDWMDYAAEHPIITPPLQVDQRADQAIVSILSHMPITPAAQALDDGISTFPTVFDLTRVQSVAYTEFAKLVASELGYLYLRKDQVYGEQLIFENAYHRNGLLPLATIPGLTSAAGELLKEDGDALLTEAGDFLLLDETEAITFADNMTGLGIQHGRNLANRIVVTAYPRKTDTSNVVLYSLGSPMQIGNRQTLTFTGNYTDPSGGRAAGGLDMVFPVATTDYTVNTLEDGSGTDLTADAVVTITFGASSASITVYNSSVQSGYITKFQLRGKGVYTYAETEFAAQDENSINQYGYFRNELDQKYQDSLLNGSAAAKTWLYHDRKPRNVIESIKYLANNSSALLRAFLFFDIGSPIKIQETDMAIDSSHIIQNISFVLRKGGLITCTYGLVEFWSLPAGSLTRLVCTLSGLGSKAAINFGYLPQVVQGSARSYAAWVYHLTVQDGTVISGPFADGGGVYIHVTSQNRVRLYSNLFNTSPGWWHSPTGSLPVEGWHHIVVTYDCWNINADPVIYIDGVSQTVTETDTPSGSLNSEYGAEVVVGNWHTATQNYGKPWHGYLMDVRIYNKILTQAEVTELYNYGIMDAWLVTDGLVFKAITVPTKEADSYDGVLLDENKKVLDCIYQAVGTPSGIISSVVYGS